VNLAGTARNGRISEGSAYSQAATPRHNGFGCDWRLRRAEGGGPNCSIRVRSAGTDIYYEIIYYEIAARGAARRCLGRSKIGSVAT
jgi:hypothetical protein